MTAPAQLGIENPLRGNAFRVEHVMGMPFSVDVRDAQLRGHRDQADAVLDQCFADLRWVDATFSLWRPETPMARLSAGQLTTRELPEEALGVLRLCVQATRATGGAFTARRPDGRIDPTGLVKGWAIARVGTLLRRAGLRHWCVNGAGDILVHGQARPGEPWAVGVVDPDQPGQLLDAVRLTHGAVATSGTAERGAHLWNPLPDSGSRPPRSVTVVSRDILTSDVLATAATAYGERAISWLEARSGVEALVVDHRGQVATTSGWAGWTERV